MKPTKPTAWAATTASARARRKQPRTQRPDAPTNSGDNIIKSLLHHSDSDNLKRTGTLAPSTIHRHLRDVKTEIITHDIRGEEYIKHLDDHFNVKLDQSDRTAAGLVCTTKFATFNKVVARTLISTLDRSKAEVEAFLEELKPMERTCGVISECRADVRFFMVRCQ